MKELNIIVAVDPQGGFGKDGKIPWHFEEDFKHFQAVTNNANCIMGRTTYEEILEHAKKRWKKKTKKKKKAETLELPKDLLPGRQCYVISRTPQTEGNVITATSIRDAINKIDNDKPVFVIGGEKLFHAALPWTKKVYLTVMKESYGCDRFFPVKYLEQHFKIVSGSQNENMFFIEYERMR